MHAQVPQTVMGLGASTMATAPAGVRPGEHPDGATCDRKRWALQWQQHQQARPDEHPDDPNCDGERLALQSQQHQQST